MDEPVELHFVELVQADQPSGVTAIAACFPAEAGAVGHVAHRKLVGRNDLVAMQGGDGHLRGGSEPEVVFSAAETLFRELGQLARPLQAGAVHQHRRQHFLVALAAVQIEHEIDQSPLQTGSLAHQGHEPALGDPH